MTTNGITYECKWCGKVYGPESTHQERQKHECDEKPEDAFGTSYIVLTGDDDEEEG